MIGRLCTATRLVVTAVLLLAFFLVIKILNLQSKDKWYYHPVHQCNHTAVELDNLIEVARRTHKLLDGQHIDHVLCYGALFGALRNGAVLPWDHDIDFCIITDDLQFLEEGYMHRLFKQKEMELRYDAEEGIYHVKFKTARCDLVVFEYTEDYQYVRRTGLKQRLVAAEKRDKFPSRLMAPPLPLKKLNKLELPAPREDMEIQKYLYPNEYWKEVKPPGC